MTEKIVPNNPMQSTPGQSTPSGLRAGFPGGNPHLAPRCGAKTRAGHPCRAPAVKNPRVKPAAGLRCRMHGGASTGPKTPEGKAAQCKSVTVHGYCGDLGRALGDLRRTLVSLGRLSAARLKLGLERS